MQLALKFKFGRGIASESLSHGLNRPRRPGCQCRPGDGDAALPRRRRRQRRCPQAQRRTLTVKLRTQAGKSGQAYSAGIRHGHDLWCAGQVLKVKLRFPERKSATFR
jgi:hypothetical protein